MPSSRLGDIEAIDAAAVAVARHLGRKRQWPTALIGFIKQHEPHPADEFGDVPAYFVSCFGDRPLDLIDFLFAPSFQTSLRK